MTYPEPPRDPGAASDPSYGQPPPTPQSGPPPQYAPPPFPGGQQYGPPNAGAGGYGPPNPGAGGYGQPYPGGGQYAPYPGGPQANQYGRPPLPGPVKVSSILLFIGGGFGVLGGLLLLALAGSANSDVGDKGLVIFVGILLLALGALEIYVGVELRRLKRWARTATIVLASIGAVLQIIGLAQGGYTNIVGLAIDVLIIYMMFRPATVAAFPAR